MQVYRGMDIGTAKATPQERARVPHHMIDLVEPEDVFSVADFQREGRAVLASLGEQDRPAVIVGGSGLHFRALVDPMEFPGHVPEVRHRLEQLPPDEAVAALVAADPSAAGHVDLDNPRRVVRALEIFQLTGHTPSERAASPESVAVRSYRPLLPFVAAGVDPGRLLGERVTARLGRMMEAGLLGEVKTLAPRLGPTASQAVGYKQLLRVVRGELSIDKGLQRSRQATMELAKRQRTYFRRDPRVRWVAWSGDPEARYAAVQEALRR